MNNADSKSCARCKQVKSIEEFPGKIGRYRCYCRACRTELRKNDWATKKNAIAKQNRDSRVRVVYGISPEEYDQLLRAQESACAICRATSGNRIRRQMLAVDHDHVTGQVRDCSVSRVTAQ